MAEETRATATPHGTKSFLPVSRAGNAAHSVSLVESISRAPRIRVPLRTAIRSGGATGDARECDPRKGTDCGRFPTRPARRGWGLGGVGAGRALC